MNDPIKYKDIPTKYSIMNRNINTKIHSMALYRLRDIVSALVT